MLSEPQLQRYSRQLLLPEIGGAGQERLLASRVEVRGEGAAVESLRGYLAAAGVGLGEGGLVVHALPRGRALETMPQAAFVLDDVGIAWSHSRPCAACLAAALAAVPLPPEWARPAVAQAAAALAASKLLLSLVGRAPADAGLYLAWPRAERRTPPSRPECDCA